MFSKYTVDAANTVHTVTDKSYSSSSSSSSKLFRENEVTVQRGDRKPAIFLATDLDYTLFISYSSTVLWIGEPEFWAKLFGRLQQLTEEQGVDLVLGVVTHKKVFDDLASAAANVLRPQLERHHPQMFKKQNEQEFILVNESGTLKFCSLESSMELPNESPSQVFSNFEISRSDSKLSCMKRILQHQDIPMDLAIMLDDTPQIISELRSAGINTISCECFHNYPPKRQGDNVVHQAKHKTRKIELADKHYISSHLSRIQMELTDLVTTLIPIAKARYAKDSTRASHQKLTISSGSLDTESAMLKTSGYGRVTCSRLFRLFDERSYQALPREIRDQKLVSGNGVELQPLKF